MADRWPVVLEAFGLIAALEDLAEQIEADTSLAVQIDVERAGDRPPPAIERVVWRVAQIAVDNAVRHAAASTITVTLWVEPDRVSLRVTDDGRGFDPAASDIRRPGCARPGGCPAAGRGDRRVRRLRDSARRRHDRPPGLGGPRHPPPVRQSRRARLGGIVAAVLAGAVATSLLSGCSLFDPAPLIVDGLSAGGPASCGTCDQPQARPPCNLDPCDSIAAIARQHHRRDVPGHPAVVSISFHGEGYYPGPSGEKILHTRSGSLIVAVATFVDGTRHAVSVYLRRRRLPVAPDSASTVRRATPDANPGPVEMTIA